MCPIISPPPPPIPLHHHAYAISFLSIDVWYFSVFPSRLLRVVPFSFFLLALNAPIFLFCAEFPHCCFFLYSIIRVVASVIVAVVAENEEIQY